MNANCTYVLSHRNYMKDKLFLSLSSQCVLKYEMIKTPYSFPSAIPDNTINPQFTRYASACRLVLCSIRNNIRNKF